MLFSQYDSETAAKLYRAFDDAWHQLEETAVHSAEERAKTTSHLLKRLMRAADDGERDPARLKSLAMEGIGVARHAAMTSNSASPTQAKAAACKLPVRSAGKRIQDVRMGPQS